MRGAKSLLSFWINARPKPTVRAGRCAAGHGIGLRVGRSPTSDADVLAGRRIAENLQIAETVGGVIRAGAELVHQADIDRQILADSPVVLDMADDKVADAVGEGVALRRAGSRDGYPSSASAIGKPVIWPSKMASPFIGFAVLV